MDTQPLITLGVTAFNAVDTIEMAIDSAFGQSWPNKEVIVVDDCSDDGTFALLTTLKDKYASMVILQNRSNSGVAVSRNAIIAQAKGEYICFFDDDDVSLPDRAAVQYCRIMDYKKNFPQADLVVSYTARTQKYPDGTVRVEPTIGTNDQGEVPHGRDVARRILYGRPMKNGFGSCATCSQMAETRLYRTIGGFDTFFRRNQDTEINIRIALAGGHFAGILTPLVVQKMTPTGDKKLEKEHMYTMSMVQKYKDFLIDEGMYDFIQQWYKLKFDLLEGRSKDFAFKILSVFAKHPIKAFRKVIWSLPNIRFNLQFKKFHAALGHKNAHG